MQVLIALALIAAGGSVEENIKVAVDHGSPAAVRLKAVRSLEQAKSEAAILPLVHELPRVDGELKTAIQHALGALHATAYFVKMLGSKEASARVHAAEMLAFVPGAEAVDPLIGALADPDAKLREEAAAALWRPNDPRAVDPLIKALTTDAAPDVRSAAAQSLGHLAGPRAKEALEKARTEEKDAFVKILIDEALAQLAPKK